MKRHNHSGFTLLELLIVVTIVAILSAIAAPSFQTMLLNNRLASATNDLLADLALARSESARQGKRVTLCISSDGESCGSGSSWQAGRIIFLDESGSGTTGTVDSGETIFRVTTAETGSNLTITASGFSSNRYIQFRPTGALTSTTTGTFTICDNRSGNFGRTIQIIPTGRASLTSSTANCS